MLGIEWGGAGGRAFFFVHRIDFCAVNRFCRAVKWIVCTEQNKVNPVYRAPLSTVNLI
jgi:hypothetical protein